MKRNWNEIRDNIASITAIIQKVFDNNDFKNFRLGGGTALALQLGHRLSVDADFFSPKSFDKDDLLKKVLQIFPNSTDIHQGAFDYSSN